jgi:hypothetical protein
MSKDPKKSLQLSRKIPASMKAKILPLVTSSSRYNNGMMFGLRKPSGMSSISSKISGVSFGADGKGFFVYTHRCRSKSYVNPLKIPKKQIDFVESTG